MGFRWAVRLVLVGGVTGSGGFGLGEAVEGVTGAGEGGGVPGAGGCLG